MDKHEVLKTFFMLLLLIGIVNSGDYTTSVSTALYGICNLFYQLFPIAIAAAVLLAGIIFGIGQVMGAETRARANVWATNLMIGALIAALVYLIAPAIIETLTGQNILASCQSS